MGGICFTFFYEQYHSRLVWNEAHGGAILWIESKLEARWSSRELDLTYDHNGNAKYED